MLTGIDHLVIAVPDPDAAAALLERELGLAAGGGGRHERLGTENRLIWLGDTYLELIGVADAAIAEASWLGAPVLHALREGGAGLATFAVASDALEADLALLRARGTDAADPVPGERARPDGRIVRWRLAAPHRLGPLEPPFLIDHDATAAEWTPEECAVRAGETHPIGGRVRLASLDLPVADTRRAAMRFLAAGIGPFRPSLQGRGARDASIGSQTLRLIPTRDATMRWPVATIRLRVDSAIAADPLPISEPEGRELVGCRWVIR